MRRRLIGILNGIAQWYRNNLLAQAAAKAIPFGEGIHHYLDNVGKSLDRGGKAKKPPGLSLDVLSVIAHARDIDDYILRKVLPLSKGRVDKTILYKIYNDYLGAHSRDRGISLDQLLKVLEEDPIPDLWRDRQAPASLRIEAKRVEKNRISELSFYMGEEKALALKPANLLWDCNCKANKVAKNICGPEVPAADCPIHSKVVDSGVDECFNKDLVQIEYDKVRVLWRQAPEFWPPSIDTFGMVEDLRNDGLLRRNVQTVLDVGSGTGFLGIWLARNNSHVKEVTFSDWLVKPIVFSAINASINLSGDCASSRYALGIGTHWAYCSRGVAAFSRNSGIYDLLICNPPSLPTPDGFEDLLINSTVAGTYLLEHIIRNFSGATRIAKEVYISISNIADNEKQDAENAVGCHLDPIGVERWVPFRVNLALENKKYMQYLLEERGLEYRKGETHPFWHRVQTYKLIN